VECGVCPIATLTLCYVMKGNDVSIVAYVQATSYELRKSPFLKLSAYIQRPRVLNAAARLVLNLCLHDHVTDPALQQLHWLPIQYSCIHIYVFVASPSNLLHYHGYF